MRLHTSTANLPSFFVGSKNTLELLDPRCALFGIRFRLFEFGLHFSKLLLEVLSLGGSNLLVEDIVLLELFPVPVCVCVCVRGYSFSRVSQGSGVSVLCVISPAGCAQLLLDIAHVCRHMSINAIEPDTISDDVPVQERVQRLERRHHVPNDCGKMITQGSSTIL